MELALDQALLVTQNLDLSSAVSIWSQVESCQNCPNLFQTIVGPQSNGTITVDTRYKVTLEVKRVSPHNETLCTIPFRWFSDHGHYQMNISERDAKWYCPIFSLKSGRNDLIPLIVTVLFYVLVAFGWMIYKRNFVTRRLDITDQTKPQRLKSLDAFRGLTMMMMIFVNYGAGGYAFLDHAPWFGLTIADVIFPWFIFIMGVSLALSIESQVKRGSESTISIWFRILERSVKLFLIGLCLNSNYSYLSMLRIPGVLQRFGVSYFFVASSRLISAKLYQKFSVGTGDDPPIRLTWFKSFLIFLPELSVYSVCLAIYFWATLFWQYDPKCPIGYQGPGGLHNHGSAFNCTGGAANHIDRIILGENHLYHTATSMEIYQNDLRHDPEGILGCTTSIVLTAIGAFAGRVIIRMKSSRERMLYWLLLSLILGLTSLIFSRTGSIPIIKNLWSFSFITCTGAMALILLTVFYWLIDLWGIWENGKPFIYPGMNPILLYIGSSILERYIPFYFGVDKTSHNELLLRVLIAVNIWYFISYQLVLRKIFITI